MVSSLTQREVSAMLKFSVLVVLLSLQGMNATAHHAMQLEYDENALLTIEGEIVRVEWTNPHVSIQVEARDNGTPVFWHVQAGTPNTLLRRGINRYSLRAREIVLNIGASGPAASQGEIVVLSGFQIMNLPCNQICNLLGEDILFPDGRAISIRAN